VLDNSSSMTTNVTIPTITEIEQRIRACREELTALRKLHRLARAAEAVRKAGEDRRQQPRLAAEVAGD
jgi:hypothetical protein